MVCYGGGGYATYFDWTNDNFQICIDIVIDGNHDIWDFFLVRDISNTV